MSSLWAMTSSSRSGWRVGEVRADRVQAGVREDSTKSRRSVTARAPAPCPAWHDAGRLVDRLARAGDAADRVRRCRRLCTGPDASPEARRLPSPPFCRRRPVGTCDRGSAPPIRGGAVALIGVVGRRRCRGVAALPGPCRSRPGRRSRRAERRPGAALVAAGRTRSAALDRPEPLAGAALARSAAPCRRAVPAARDARRRRQRRGGARRRRARRGARSPAPGGRPRGVALGACLPDAGADAGDDDRGARGDLAAAGGGVVGEDRQLDRPAVGREPPRRRSQQQREAGTARRPSRPRAAQRRAGEERARRGRRRAPGGGTAGSARGGGRGGACRARRGGRSAAVTMIAWMRWQRCAGDEVVVLLGQPPAGAEERGLDGRAAHAHALADLAVGQALELAQHEDLVVGLRQAAERAAQVVELLLGGDRGVGQRPVLTSLPWSAGARPVVGVVGDLLGALGAAERVDAAFLAIW